MYMFNDGNINPMGNFTLPYIYCLPYSPENRFVPLLGQHNALCSTSLCCPNCTSLFEIHHQQHIMFSTYKYVVSMVKMVRSCLYISSHGNTYISIYHVISIFLYYQHPQYIFHIAVITYQQ